MGGANGTTQGRGAGLIHTWRQTGAVLSKAAGAKTLRPAEQLAKRKLKGELEVWASHWCKRMSQRVQGPVGTRLTCAQGRAVRGGVKTESVFLRQTRHTCRENPTREDTVLEEKVARLCEVIGSGDQLCPRPPWGRFLGRG